MLVVAAVTRWC